MRENVDLERDILLYLEEHDKNNEGIEKYKFLDFIQKSGIDSLIVLKHCCLLEERGFIKFKALSAGNDEFYECHVGPVTAVGYDFIASTRNNKVWEKIKEKLFEKGLDGGLVFIMDYLPVIIKSMID